MKNFAIHLIVLSFPFFGFGQKVNFNTIVLPSSASDISLEEKLVRLAWNNSPETEISKRQVNIAQYDIKKARRNWLNNLKITGNLNEFNLNESADVSNRSDFFPRYNIGLSLPLGSLFINPLESKQMVQKQEIAIQTINQQKLSMRAETLTRYQLYLMSKEILDIRVEAQEDSYANYSLIEQSFKNGESSILQYNAALEKYSNQRQSKIEAESQFIISKIALEELIGVALEDVQ